MIRRSVWSVMKNRINTGWRRIQPRGQKKGEVSNKNQKKIHTKKKNSRRKKKKNQT